MLKKYNELLNLDATIAKDLFERVEHPWEVLPLIKGFILEIIPTLGSEFRELSENVFVHESVKIADAATLNASLDDIQPALVYRNGMTYYYMDIKHLGNKDKVGEFGIVRNHVYSVNITDINGFGTPVYEGTHDFVKPEKPEPVTSYVAAQINILSWRVVANDYELN